MVSEKLGPSLGGLARRAAFLKETSGNQPVGDGSRGTPKMGGAIICLDAPSNKSRTLRQRID